MRTALVTGGSRGIGRAICDMLADSGFSLAIGYNSGEKEVKEMLSRYLSRGINCIAVRADLSQKDGADKLLEGLKGFPAIDTLINNAGVSYFNTLEKTSDGDIERVMNVNFLSPLKLIRGLSENMRSRGFGRIVNITSMWALVGSSCESVYSASKAALTGASKSLAKEFAGSGMTVNCIAPGLIDTDMNSSLSAEEKAEIVRATPLARMGKPSDVAAAVKFFIDENCFATGETLNLSGGFAIT